MICITFINKLPMSPVLPVYASLALRLWHLWVPADVQDPSACGLPGSLVPCQCVTGGQTCPTSTHTSRSLCWGHQQCSRMSPPLSPRSPVSPADCRSLPLAGSYEESCEWYLSCSHANARSLEGCSQHHRLARAEYSRDARHSCQDAEPAHSVTPTDNEHYVICHVIVTETKQRVQRHTLPLLRVSTILLMTSCGSTTQVCEYINKPSSHMRAPDADSQQGNT